MTEGTVKNGKITLVNVLFWFIGILMGLGLFSFSVYNTTVENTKDIGFAKITVQENKTLLDQHIANQAIYLETFQKNMQDIQLSLTEIKTVLKIKSMKE